MRNGSCKFTKRASQWYYCRLRDIIHTYVVLQELNGETLATRNQIPLLLAFGFTIHKAQGMELQAAAMDLKDCFLNGQVYSAVSRVKDLAGLFLISFDPNKVMASELALNF